MNWYKKMKLKIISAILAILQPYCGIYSFSPVFDFTMDVLKINRTDLQSTIINASYHTDDIMECTYRCDEVYHLSVYYLTNEKTCHCNIDIDRTAVGVANSDLLYGIFNHYVQILGGSSSIETVPLKFDCLDIYQTGIQDDGIYIINPLGTKPVEAWCDMEDGGWTVFQRRMNGKVDFYRNWTEYQNDFGDKNEEYWLGLDNIHALTQASASLKIYLGRFENVTPGNCSVEYSWFVVTDVQDNYRIIVDGYSGSCPDLLGGGFVTTIINNSQFSTGDNDNDYASPGVNCATAWYSSWWFNDCFHTNLNGHYRGPNNTYPGHGIIAADYSGWYENLKTAVMKVRRN